MGREVATHLINRYDGVTVAVSYVDPDASLEHVKQEYYRVVLGPRSVESWQEIEDNE